MERRAVLKAGLGMAAILVAERFCGPEPAEAQAPPRSAARFFSGSVFEGGMSMFLGIGIRGTTARGFVHSPDFLDNAWRLEGKFRRNTLSLGMFALADPNALTPLGSLTGQLQGGTSLFGTWSLGTGRMGSFGASQLPLNFTLMRSIAGRYAASVLDTDSNAVLECELRTTASGIYNLTRLQGQKELPRKLTGVFGIDPSGMWAVVMPTYFRFDPATIFKLRGPCCPPIAQAPFEMAPTAAGWRLRHPFENLTQVSFRF